MDVAPAGGVEEATAEEGEGEEEEAEGRREAMVAAGAP